MKMNNAIKDRNRQVPTLYHLSGMRIKISDEEELPAVLYRMNKSRRTIRDVFHLSAVTVDFLYFIDEEEADGLSGVVMLNRELELVSDNFFAANDLFGVVADNMGLLWVSDTVRHWQLEQFVQPDMMTEEIVKELDSVDIEKLTDEERRIFFAYLHNGPIRYTKAQSLMAVLYNDLHQQGLSEQLNMIWDKLEGLDSSPI